MQQRIIPDVVCEQDVVALSKTSSVHDAVQVMSTRNIAAVAVTDGDNQLLGIISERDITHRVLACGLNPQATPLVDIMTENPETLHPSDKCLDATELMLTRNIRHLPVVNETNHVIAMVSMRDLLNAAVKQLNMNIDEAQRTAFGPEDA